MSTVGVVSWGDIISHEYRGGCSVLGGSPHGTYDIMMHVGGYHEYRGGISSFEI